METTVREYEDWIAEEEAEAAAGGEDPVAEMLRAKADEARCPTQTWLMPVLTDINHCIKSRYFTPILQEMNRRLVDGNLSELLGRAVVSERIAAKDLEIGEIACWRLNRTDFLADIDLDVDLTAEEDGRDLPRRVKFCLTLWFCTEEGFSFEVQELHLAANKPDRSFWKLDRYLVPILRNDEIEAGADSLWANHLPEAKNPKERFAPALAEKLNLTIVKLPLYCQNHTKSILFFQDGTVSVHAEVDPGETDAPLSVPREIKAGTIVLNTNARSRFRGQSLDIYHECIHYEWHLLFYRLQKLMTTNPQEIRYTTVRSSGSRPSSTSLRQMEHHADLGSKALLLPLDLIRPRAWRLYQQASASPSVNGYQNHPGFRWERVILRLADEYNDAPRTEIRARLVGMGHTSAKGAVNFIDGKYITPFAFTEEHTSRRGATLVISRKATADLYHRNGEFRQFMSRGEYVWADGHVCINNPQYLRATDEGARLTPWANAHADTCCIRFEQVWLPESEEYVWLFGTLNSSEDYNREYNHYLSRRTDLSARQQLELRNRLMQSMPVSFPDALVYLMENRAEGAITVEKLAAAAQVSTKTIQRYRNDLSASYHPDAVVAICIALHLPPWLSRVLLDKAGIAVRSYGPRGYYGEILDCYYMDTIPQIQKYLESSGYPKLKLQET